MTNIGDIRKPGFGPVTEGPVTEKTILSGERIMQPRVKILMSTYNGEKYLPEQVESLIRQTAVNVDIDIRDDGSTDNTVSMLKGMADRQDNIHIRQGENAGPAGSFLELLYSTEAGYDYYAFSDQDDIWDEDKLQRAIEMIREQETDEPVLYYSALNTFNSQTGEKALIANEREYSLEETFIQSHYPGCTMVFNKAAFDLLRNISRPSAAVMHDLFVVQVFMCMRYRIIYDRESRINYRIHGNNVSVKPSDLFGAAKRIMEIMKKQKGLRHRAAKAFAEVMGNRPEGSAKETLDAFAGYRDSFKAKQKLIRLIGKTGFSFKIKKAFQLAVLFNFY